MPEFDKDSVPLKDQVRDQSVRQQEPATSIQARLLEQHRSATRPVDPRDAASQAITDFFRGATVNGYSISIQGNNISIPVSALTPQPVPALTPIVPSAQPPAVSESIRGPVQSPSVSAAPAVQPLGSLLDHAYSRSGQRGERIEAREEPAVYNFPQGAQPGVSPKSTSLDRAYDRRSTTPHAHHKTGEPESLKAVSTSRNNAASLGSTVIPVQFTRADGGRTILAFLDVPTSYVVSGESGGERPLPDPPDTDSYYVAGGSGSSSGVPPFGFYPVTTDGNTVLRCNAYSYLFNADMDGTTADLSGLSGDFTPNEGDFAWIEVSQDADGTVTATEFMVDAPWDSSPAFFTLNSDDPDAPFIESFYYPVAKFVSADSDEPGTLVTLGTTEAPNPIKIVQLATCNQLLVLRVINGIVCWTTENFGGGV